MALLSRSMRPLSSSFWAAHSSGLHGRSSSGGKSSEAVSRQRTRANSEWEFDSASVSSLAEVTARGDSLFRRVHLFGIDGKFSRGGESDSAVLGQPGELDDGKEKVRVVEGTSTLFYSCAGITVTPGIAAALPLSAVTMHDIIACAITVAGALSMLKFFDELAKRDVLDKKLSRKLVHILVGLGYMLFWPLFSTSPYAKYLCALAPAGNGVRMLGLGFGLLENEAMIKAMSREGDRRELLKGPFYYALAIVVTTVCFWRTSPVGIVALVNLCSGDGFADIVGRNFGGEFRLPWNEEKSWAGSLAFFVSSTAVSMLYLLYFAHFGFLVMQPGIFAGVALVSFLTALVESLPISTRWDDNLTVPFAAMAFGIVILPSL